MDLQAIRTLLRQGDTGKALEALIDLIKQDERYRAGLLRTLLVLEGEYNAVRQKELKGILPFAEAQRKYNATNDSILAILDDFENGRIPPAASLNGGSFRNNRLILIVGVLLVSVILVVWKVMGNSGGECPEFENPKARHILVLPFDPLDAAEAPVHLRIQESINTLTRKAGILVEVKIGQRSPEDPSSLELANRRGRQCQADLVVYGQYKKFSEDSIRVNLGYSFMKAGQSQTGSLPFRTFRDITEVQVTRGFEDALFALCAMIAVDDQNWPVARRWMDKIQDKEVSEVKMADWLEAHHPSE
ncbi:MAG: hypothetical protein EP344_11160 [Bacteroidetes bacterium]|nr:MAG: hypothetical protein EP344_11160 [Bacteroidota bacterium]